MSINQPLQVANELTPSIQSSSAASLFSKRQPIPRQIPPFDLKALPQARLDNDNAHDRFIRGDAEMWTDR